MHGQRHLTLLLAHAEGEVGRVIVAGVDDPPGTSMLEKRRYLERHDDGLRRLCLFEPRGGAAMSANLALPPADSAADVGMIVMESVDYPAMSGSNAICVVTALLETGRLTMVEPETAVVLDTPAGLVRATATCRDGKCARVTLEAMPCFVERLDATLEVSGLGTLSCDVAYGGAVFALVDAARLGFALTPAEARVLVELGQRITDAAAEQLELQHPALPDAARVSFTHFGAPPDADGVRKSAVVVQPGRLDRSPCGTGTLAKLAALHARGEIGVGERLVHESPIGTRFIAELVAETVVGGRPAIVPRLTGRGWLVGTMELWLDPSDPFPAGFVMTDTWGPDAARLTAPLTST